VDAERWTRLGAAIRMAADETASSTCGQAGASDPEVRQLAIGRLQRLERIGRLVTAAVPVDGRSRRPWLWLE